MYLFSFMNDFEETMSRLYVTTMKKLDDFNQNYDPSNVDDLLKPDDLFIGDRALIFAHRNESVFDEFWLVAKLSKNGFRLYFQGYI